MLVRDLPVSVVLYEDQRSLILLLIRGAGSLEIGVEDESCNRDIAEHVNLQVIGVHFQITDGIQTLMLTLSAGCCVLPAGWERREFGEAWAVEMITVQPC